MSSATKSRPTTADSATSSSSGSRGSGARRAHKAGIGRRANPLAQPVGLGSKLGASRKAEKAEKVAALNQAAAAKAEAIAAEKREAAAAAAAAASLAKGPRSKRSFDSVLSSSEGHGTATTATPAASRQRKVLMPTIPVRRTSNAETTASAASGAASPPPPAEPGKTAIQFLASAIAARAQQVAAENAAKKAAAAAAATPGGLTTEILYAGEDRSSSVASNLSDNVSALGVNGSSAASEASTPKASRFPHSISTPPSLPPTSELSQQTSPDSAMPIKRDSVASEASSRWSRSEWADFGNIIHHVDFGSGVRPSESSHSVDTAATSNGGSPEGGIHSQPKSTTPNGSSQYARGKGSLDSSGSSGNSAGERSLSGLGIGGAVTSPGNQVSPGLSAPTKSSSMMSISSFATAQDNTPTLSPNAFSSPDSNGHKLGSPMSGLSGRRKARPAALALEGSSNPSSPAAMKGAPSPIPRGMTPPPTRPPAEPLPPLPSTPSTVMLNKSATRNSGGNRQRMKSDSGDWASNSSSFSGSRASADSIASLVNASRSPQVVIQPTTPPTKRAEVSNKTKNTPSTTNAVLANHAQTTAGSEHAQALLREIEPEPTYNARRASQKASAAAMAAAAAAANGKAPSMPEDSNRANYRNSVESSYSVASYEAESNHKPLGQVEESETEVEEEDNDMYDAEEDMDPEVAVVRTAERRGSEDSGTQLSRAGAAPVLLKATPSGNGRTALQPASSLRTPTRVLAAQLAPANSGSVLNRPRGKPNKAGEGPLSPGLSTDGKSPVGSPITPGSVASPLTPGSANGARAPRQPPTAWTGPVATPAASPAAAAPRTAADKAKDSASATITKLAGTAGQRTPASGSSEADHDSSHPRFSVTSTDESSSGVQSRRSEMDLENQSPSFAPSEKVKRVNGRFTGAFGEVAKAFKQLQIEKRQLEKIIRATTPLDGLGDGSGLSTYLATMSAKLELSSGEIRKLLDLLDQQRAVMDYMLETHQLEIDSHEDDIDDLRDALEVALGQAEMHESEAIKATEELNRSRNQLDAARIETQKVHKRLLDEESQRERAVTLLRAARDELQKTEKVRKELASRTEAAEREASHLRSLLVPLQQQLADAAGKSDAGVLAHKGQSVELEQAHARNVKELTASHLQQVAQLQDRIAELERLNSRPSSGSMGNASRDSIQASMRAARASISSSSVGVDDQMRIHYQQLEKVYDEMADAMSDNVAARKRIAELESQLESKGGEAELHRKLEEVQASHQAEQRELRAQLEASKKAHEVTRQDMEKSLSLMTTDAGDDETQRLKAAKVELEQAHSAHVSAQSGLQSLLSRMASGASLTGLTKSSSAPTIAAAGTGALTPTQQELVDARTKHLNAREAQKESLLRVMETERERDELQRKVQQQEQDIAELRAAIVLGNPNSPSHSKAVGAGAADQVQALMTQLAEQRARETQIRNAYKAAREELRKVQSAQTTERKRSNAGGFSYLNSSGSASGHGERDPPLSAGGPLSARSLAGPPSASSNNAGSKKLKRLSLPLTAGPISPAAASYGARPETATSSTTASPGRFVRSSSHDHTTSPLSSLNFANGTASHDTAMSHGSLRSSPGSNYGSERSASHRDGSNSDGTIDDFAEVDNDQVESLVSPTSATYEH